MGGYRIFFRKSVEKDLSGIPKKDIERILNRIKDLGKNPRPPGFEKLTGQERFRLRQGRYRIVYSIQDDELTIWIVTIKRRGGETFSITCRKTKKSPFDVPGIKTRATTKDILAAVRESRERFSGNNVEN